MRIAICICPEIEQLTKIVLCEMSGRIFRFVDHASWQILFLASMIVWDCQSAGPASLIEWSFRWRMRSHATGSVKEWQEVEKNPLSLEDLFLDCSRCLESVDEAWSWGEINEASDPNATSDTHIPSSDHLSKLSPKPADHWQGSNPERSVNHQSTSPDSFIHSSVLTENRRNERKTNRIKEDQSISADQVDTTTSRFRT